MAQVRALLLPFALAAGVAVAPFAPAAARPDPADLCAHHIDWVERSGLVPRGLLHAIALVESGRWLPDRRQSRPWPWTVTAGDEAQYFPTEEAALGAIRRLQAAGRTNIDVGCMQVNLRYHGQTFAAFADPAGALLDPAANVAYAAAFLQRLRAEAQSWEQAAAYYHSRDPEVASAYHARVSRFWREEDAARLLPAAVDVRRPEPADGSAAAAGRGDGSAPTVQELARLADGGDPDAQEGLADLYARGDGVPRDAVQALKWYMLAALHGRPARTLPLDRMRRGMTPEQIREAGVQVLSWDPARRPDPAGLGGGDGRAVAATPVPGRPPESRRAAPEEVDCDAGPTPIRRKLCQLKRRQADPVATELANWDGTAGDARPSAGEAGCGDGPTPIRRKLCQMKLQRADLVAVELANWEGAVGDAWHPRDDEP